MNMNKMMKLGLLGLLGFGKHWKTLENHGQIWSTRHCPVPGALLIPAPGGAKL